MTLHDIVSAIPSRDSVTVANYIGGQIYVDRAKTGDFMYSPLYFTLRHSMVYKLEVGKCFNDLIIHICLHRAD